MKILGLMVIVITVSLVGGLFIDSVFGLDDGTINAYIFSPVLVAACIWVVYRAGQEVKKRREEIWSAEDGGAGCSKGESGEVDHFDGDFGGGDGGND